MLAWPGLGARAKNPYTWLLYSHLAALGVRVRDFTPARALLGGYDVLHVHWPEKAPRDVIVRRCKLAVFRGGRAPQAERG